MRSPVARRLSAVALGVALLAAAGCSDDAEGTGDPQQVLADAADGLSSTPGVRLSLTTDDLPDGVTGVTRAEGIATDAPAFEGDLTVVLSGQEFEVPVVAVDDEVHVQLPLTSGWQVIDPAEYGAPDPASFLDAEGFPAVLEQTTAVESGEPVRGGEDNDEVLTEITGSVPGDAVAGVIPTASGDFDATYTVTDDGELREAVLTGTFYADAETMTYTVGFEDYGTEQDITAP